MKLIKKLTAAVLAAAAVYAVLVFGIDFYVKQKERAYGNVLHKTEKEIKEEFEKRKKLNYPQCNGLCENCIQYYGEVLKDLEAIFNDKKEVLFF